MATPWTFWFTVPTALLSPQGKGSGSRPLSATICPLFFVLFPLSADDSCNSVPCGQGHFCDVPVSVTCSEAGAGVSVILK